MWSNKNNCLVFNVMTKEGEKKKQPILDYLKEHAKDQLIDHLAKICAESCAKKFQ